MDAAGRDYSTVATATAAATLEEHNHVHDSDSALELPNGSSNHNVDHDAAAFAENHGLDALQAATVEEAGGGDLRANANETATGEHHHHRHHQKLPLGSVAMQDAVPSEGAMSASAVAAAAVAATRQLGHFSQEPHDPAQEQPPDNHEPDNNEPGRTDRPVIPVDINLTFTSIGASQVDPALGGEVDQSSYHEPSHSPQPHNVQHQHQHVHPSTDHYPHPQPSPPQQPAHQPHELRTIHPQQPCNVPSVVASPVARDSPSNQKKTRLSRACDGCSLRKVKCDASGPPCKPCQDLQVPCTNEREKKRRGPPNRHLDKLRQGSMAVKRPRADPETHHHHYHIEASPVSTGLSVAAPPAGAGLDIETIAPFQQILGLVDDFFNFVYPLLPFPHGNNFRAALLNRDDRRRADFLGLTTSMLATLAALFPRTVRQHLKAHAQSDHGAATVPAWPHSAVFAARCRDMALLSRGHDWPLRQPKTLDDAMTSYFLGVASEALGNVGAMRMFMAEAVAILGEVDLSRRGLPLSTNARINDHLMMRVYWSIVQHWSALIQDGHPNKLCISQETGRKHYSEFPQDASAHAFDFDGISTSTAPAFGPMAGFRASLRVYNAMEPFVEADPGLTAATKRDLLTAGLSETKNIIRGLPAELQISSDLADSAFSFADLDQFRVELGEPHRRRSIQLDIQKANLHVSLLATREYFVTQHSILCDGNLASIAATERAGSTHGNDGDGTLKQMLDEREFLAHNVMAVMATLPRHSLEPNFHSISARLVRVINCALSRPIDDDPAGSIEPRQLDELRWLRDWLHRADQALAPTSASEAPVTGEDEALGESLWVELRNWQRRIAGAGADDDEEGLPMDLDTIKFEAHGGGPDAEGGLPMDEAAYARMEEAVRSAERSEGGGQQVDQPARTPKDEAT